MNMSTESDNTNTAPKCSNCLLPSSLKCSRCHVTYYCDVSCQKSHWKAHKGSCLDLARDHLKLRESPGFVVTVQARGAQRRLPLRAVTQLDGFGELGLFLYYSGHEGAEAIRWAIELSHDDCDNPLEYINSSAAVWCTMTEPIHSRRQLKKACIVAVHPKKGKAEAQAMVDAGLARWCPELEDEPCGYHGGAPMLELLGAEKWTKIDPNDYV